MKHQGRYVLLGLVLLSAFAGLAHAVPVTLDAEGDNLLEFQFTLPAQPASHNALNINVTSSMGPVAPAFGGVASLFDGATLLASGLTTSVGRRFATPGSAFSAMDPLINDYSAIADGSINGFFRLLVTSGSRSFDTDDLTVRPFGDAGSAPGTAGTVFGVSVGVAPPVSVSESPTIGLLGLGLVLFLLRRSRKV